MPKNTKRFSLVKALGWVLTLIGKPFYFVLSYIVLALILTLYAIGHTTWTTFEFIFKPRKIVLPKIKFPRLRIFELRVFLLELKIFSKLKKAFKKVKKPKIRPGILVFVSILTFFVLGFWYFIIKDLPSPEELTTRQIEVSTKIYDRNGNLLYKIYKDKNRTVISLNEIPPHVRLATLAAEDAEFYEHSGFSLRGISRAFFQNLRSGKLQGGSTITQQLVKNALLSPEKTLARKVKEVILSVQVEYTFSKDEILEMYLNEVSYGGTSYGIEEASQEYFGKGVHNLNLAEAAFLAGLPQSPTRFSPFGETADLGLTRQKRSYSL